MRRLTLIEITLTVALLTVFSLAGWSFTTSMVRASGDQTVQATFTAEAVEALRALGAELSVAELLYREEDLGVDLDGDGDQSSVVRGTPAGRAALAAQPALFSTGARSLAYRVPVDADLDGDVLDDEGQVTWGVRAPDGAVAGLDLSPAQADPDTCYVEVRFVSLGELREAELGVDYDRDGRRTSVLERGYLERRIHVGGEVVFSRRLTGEHVLVGGALGADLDGDGAG
ncbi:MAG TPA: hypothetical protein DEA08_14735, partial [Planctomycetes bacterium]|nr:hypothetical protein [Planctomycetota bacterium]